MIIQCPSCSTKFAVDSSQLADVENPRFHCSRCDHFFESPEFGAKPPEPAAKASTEQIPAVSASAQQLSLIESQFGIPSQFPPVKETPPASSSTPVPESIPENFRSLHSQIEIEVIRSAQQRESDAINDAFMAEMSREPVAAQQSVESARAESSKVEIGNPEMRRNAERVMESAKSFDIEETPFVRADWPEGTADTLYEADLSAYRPEPIGVRRESEDDIYSPDIENTLFDPILPPEDEIATAAAEEEEDTGTHDFSGPATDPINAAEQDAFEDDSWISEDEDIIEDVSDEWEASPPLEEDSFSDDSLEDILPDEFPDDVIEAREAAKSPSQAAAPEAVSYPAASAASRGMTARPEDIWKGTAPATARALVDEPRPEQSAKRGLSIRLFPKKWLPRGVGIAGSAPLLMMLGVWWWSQHLDRTPQSLKNFLHIDSVGLPQLAPRGLEAVDLRSELVTLDDGSRVLEIRGNVVNGTTKPYGRVKIEAKIFDQNNKELGRLLVDQQAAFAEARLEALSAKVLTSMQEDESHAFVRLNPNEKIPFRIVFTNLNTDVDLTAAQWFSTRIYSIEKALS